MLNKISLVEFVTSVACGWLGAAAVETEQHAARATKVASLRNISELKILFLELEIICEFS